MPCLIRILTPDGLLPADYSAESLADAAKHEPHEGVYTITNTYNIFQVLKLDAHLDRLEDSARKQKITLQLDRSRLRSALRSMLDEAGFGSVRFRVTVPAEQPDHLILSVEPFKPLPPEIYATGVRCITVPGPSRHEPSAKTTDWMHDRSQIEAFLPPGIFTGLLLDSDGKILEGLSSNFYAILNGDLRSAGQGVLPGIAQQVVFEVVPAIVPLRKEPVCVRDIPMLEEAFITSSSRGIVPVVEIDDVQIRDGTPGPITRSLREAYQVWVDEHLEDL